MDIRKFKQWQDAEYTVKSIDTSRMRLSVNGVTGEHLALSNVCIEHKGHPVSVGSGFTSEEKVKYAQNPDLIVSHFPGQVSVCTEFGADWQGDYGGIF